MSGTKMQSPQKTHDEWQRCLDSAPWRPLEVAICKGDRTWYAGVFIEIPDDTPEDKIQEVASEITLAHPCFQGEDIAHVWVYNSMDDKRPEKIQQTA